MAHELEAPGTNASPEWASLYRSRGAEVVGHRPVFSGDVFVDVAITGETSPKSIMVLQHPCAIRLDGMRLASKLLVAEVNSSEILQPSKWAGGYFKVLPLAELRPTETTKHYAASFDKHHLVTPAHLDAMPRSLS